MEFTQKFKKKFKSSKLRMLLALELDVSYYTIDRRLNLEKQDELTKPKYLEALCKVSGLPESEIFVSDGE